MSEPSASSRPSLDEHLEKSSSRSHQKKNWDDASAMSLGELSLDSDIQAMSREAHALLNQILNETSESQRTETTPGKSRRKKSSDHTDSAYEDEELEEELGRVDDISDDIRALSAELNAVRTNELGQVIAPLLSEPTEEDQLELLESVELSCVPKAYRRDATSGDTGSKMVRFDPAVEELKALRVAISNKDIAPAPARGRAIKKEVPGRLEDGVDQAIMIVCIFIWTLIVIALDHTRTEMMSRDGVLQLPWVFRIFS